MRNIRIGVAVVVAGLVGLAAASLPACSAILDTDSLSGGDVGLPDLAVDAGARDTAVVDTVADLSADQGLDQTPVDLLVDQILDQPQIGDQTVDTTLDLPPADMSSDTTFDLPVIPADISMDVVSPDTFVAPTEAGATEAGATEAGVTEAGATEAGVTEAGVTEAGATEAGVTEAGATEAGVTEAGVTEAGATEAGATEAGVTEAGASDAAVADAASPQITGTITLDAGVTCNAGTPASDCIGLLSILEFPCSGGSPTCAVAQVLLQLVDHDASDPGYSYSYSVSGMTPGATVYLDVLLEEAGGTVLHPEGVTGDLAATIMATLVVPAQGAPALVHNFVLIRD